MGERTEVFKPSPPQLRFLRSQKKYVGYGGARGGGKSWVLRLKACSLGRTYSGIQILLVRKTYKQLKNNHVNFLIPMLHGIARYNRTDKQFTFYNGSTITLGYCATDGDLEQYQGAEYDVIFIDEATNLREEWVKVITACLRGVNGFPKRVYYTMNPGSVSHSYFKRLFLDRQYEDGQDPDEYEYIPARVTDNKALMASQPDYIKQLQALPPHLREMWLEGSWDIVEGVFFEEFRNRPEHYKDRQWTHVIEPFDIPKSWEVYRSFDWGFRRPFSCGYWAVDYDGVAYRIMDFYGCEKDRNGTSVPNEGLKWSPDRVFDEMYRLEHEHPLLAGRDITGVADPAIWDAETGISIAETAANHGIMFFKGDHKRQAGWMQCHYRMRFNAEGYPMMYVFSSCRDFIRTIPMLLYDEHKPEELDTTMEDHIADEMRYFFMSRPIRPEMIEDKFSPMYGADPLNQFEEE